MTDPLIHQPVPLTVTDIAGLTKSLEHLNARLQISERRTVIMGAALMILICLVVYVIYLTVHVQSIARCQSQQNDAFSSALLQRTDAQNKERAAQRQLFNVFLNPSSTAADRQKAIQDYYAGLVAADQQRSQNPLPTSNNCI